MKYLAFLSVLMLLGSAQWLMVNSLPFDDGSDPSPMETECNEMTDGLYQGDMVLRDEQRQALVARKAIKGEKYRWPKSADGTVNIDYRFTDKVVDRTLVRLGMSRLQEATCVKFNEIPAQVEKPHLIIKTHAKNCDSYVGRIESENGQVVNLAPGCFDEGEGTVVHELGHALGLHHEQTRSDRDDYLYIMLKNVDPCQTSNYDKEESDNYGLPYDYSSIMHYDGKSFSKNKRITMAPKDPLAEPLLGSNDLSFMDKKIVNLMYKCIDTWLAKCKLTVDPCKNLGYTNSKCVCECPAGTSGKKCETFKESYIEAVIKKKSPNSQRITTPGKVTSPGYPTPQQKAIKRIQSIVAPNCHKVELTFNDFDMQACKKMFLGIRLDYPSNTTTKYCGEDIEAPQTFESEGQFIVLTYINANMKKNKNKGYSATVKFVPETTGDCSAAINSGDLPLIRNSPGTVVSTGNALNNLVNGQRGNHQGLNAAYTVV